MAGADEVQRLASLVAALAHEVGTAPAGASTRDKVEQLLALETAGRALEAARLATLRSLEGDDLTEVGATSLHGLLVQRCRTGQGRARADVLAARVTDPAPSVLAGDDQGALRGMGAALAEGLVSRDHLDVAARTLDKVPHRLRREAAPVVDEFLVTLSQKHPPRTCENLAAELLDHLDPSRTERGFDPEAFRRRRFDVVTDSTGMVVVRGQLDPVTGARFKAAVEHFAAPLPATTVEDADGDGPGSPGEQELPLGWDARTPTQRRADAVGVLTERALAAAGSRGGEPPRVVVHTTVDQLAALGSGSTHAEQVAAGRAWCEQTGFITPAVLDRLGCSALLEKVLLAPSGAVLQLGRAARFASPAQRRALAARDRGCVVPGCGRPANQCDAHHVDGWALGGRTDVDRMALLCGPHHTAVHAGVYELVVRRGVPWVRLPAQIDPARPLVRDLVHRDAHHARALGEGIRRRRPVPRQRR